MHKFKPGEVVWEKLLSWSLGRKAKRDTLNTVFWIT